MAHMRFTYQKSNEHPFLSVLNYVFGLLYALSGMMALSSLILGQNIVSGNRWIDSFIFILATFIFVFIQSRISNAMNPHSYVNDEKNAEISETAEVINSNENNNCDKMESRKKEKKTYCKKCGSEIDSKTKKCTGCGKQYGVKKIFPTSYKPLLYSLFVFSLVINVALAGTAYNYRQKYEKKLEDWYDSRESLTILRSQLSSANKILDSKEEYIDDLLIENVSMAGQCNFFDEHACIVTTEGRKYHKYNCYHWKNSDSFWIYNIEAAEYKGYTACLDCY